ncbi:MAG: hypothetical protein KGK30_08275, partial [Elusimicrobia bacterium]|nr:hypothetical protein [Elusimicrobiota bacterium]
RLTKYALEQKTRRCRVAFEALKDYFKKENRNAWIVSSLEIEQSIERILAALAKAPPEVMEFNRRLGVVLGKTIQEQELGALLSSMPPTSTRCYRDARAAFAETMRLVAKELVKAWDSDRYIRE